ncbi:MAG TPA: magnesium transporter [Verrucomicrobiae bacterium]|nr:magnesium transporter [Verrucomicrobiae bacterium]
MLSDPAHLNQPVLSVARKDFATLDQRWTAREALDAIRSQGVGEKIVYFYAVDEAQHLTGVVPTRRLLTAALEQPISEIMIRRVAAIPASATLLEACEAFVLHKFLAFPVVDEDRKIVGIVDAGFFTQEVFEMASEGEGIDEMFEALGFHIAQAREASPWRAFRLRFPWLLATISSGTVCALLSSRYEVTLARSIVLAFFLTLVLGLAESVSIQSMTMTIQALRAVRPTAAWYFRAAWREGRAAMLLGGACGTVVGLIVWLWRGHAMGGVSIGLSIFLAVCSACFFGLSVPAALHALRLDPKIAAGPVTLALADIFTLVFYFNTAAWLL